MTKKESAHVWDCVEMEGFDYAFMHYSDFKCIKDPQFHQLRQAYIDARSALETYVLKKVEAS